jgi:hypothetical protein
MGRRSGDAPTHAANTTMPPLVLRARRRTNEGTGCSRARAERSAIHFFFAPQLPTPQLASVAFDAAGLLGALAGLAAGLLAMAGAALVEAAGAALVAATVVAAAVAAGAVSEAVVGAAAAPSFFAPQLPSFFAPQLPSLFAPQLPSLAGAEAEAEGAADEELIAGCCWLPPHAVMPTPNAAAAIARTVAFTFALVVIRLSLCSCGSQP